MGAQDHDQERAREIGRDGGGTRPCHVEFAADRRHQLAQPLAVRILPRAQHDDRRQGRQDQVLVRLLEQQPAAHQFRLGLGLDVRLDQDGAGVPEAQIGRPR